jgi:Sulfatase
MGWDRLREEIFARQKRMGIVPKNAKLSPRPASLPAWDSLDGAHKRVYARLMEAFAASVAFSDAQTARVIDEIRRSGEFDNTLIVYIEGDNGSSAEGGLAGLAYEQSTITGRTEKFEELAADLDAIGGPTRYNHMPAAWAWATNAPFPWWKQIASQAGGVRNGMVVSWPREITDKGAIRTQYAHVSDIMPTLLDCIGIQPPAVLDGVIQKPLDGISLRYSFTQANAPSARRTQVYEMMENFGIYHDGWMAGTLPKRPAWEAGAAGNRRLDIGPDQRQWTLFNLDRDFTTAVDLAKSNPAKLKELQDLFWQEARKNNILPIHDYSQGSEGRPSLGGGRSRFVFQDGLTRLHEDAAPHTIGKSFTIEAQVNVGSDGSGVITAQGGRFGGYSLFLKHGVPSFHYNAVGLDQFTVRGQTDIPAGKHVITVRFNADEPKPGTAGTASLLVDGREVGSGRIGRTVAGWLSHTEGLDIGLDSITAVSEEYTPDTSRFTGSIDQVVVTIDP